ncbi:hypothetical protein HUN42_00016 [Streptomyces phage Dagobah]|nr:hypothetical protein HUN42_00016 [Streptomyces phage Dagobah]
MGRVVYTTREAVADAFDVRESANRFAQVDSAIASASDDIDGWLNRHKHGVAPTRATRYFDFPDSQYTAPYRVWFEENEAVSITTFTVAGTDLVEGTDYFLEPVNSGPPYTYAEINRSGSATLSNNGTPQRAIAATGVFGLGDDQDPAGTLVGGVNASVTALTVSDGSLVGVGSVLSLGDERVAVTGRNSASTGQTIQADLDDLDSDTTVAVADGTAIHPGETITVGSERMRVITTVGNSLTVERAVEGSTLAAHTTGATVYADRALTVERAVLGTTAASHSDALALTKWRVPDLIEALCRAEAISRLEQEWSAYGARVYSDEAERDSSGTEVVAGRGLTDIRKSAARRYKRKFRKRAV